MRLLADLRCALAYDLVPITQENYTIAREVYNTNPGYFQLFDKVPSDENILSTMRMVPDGYGIEDKLFAALCENSEAVAVIDLLAGYPDKNNLWLGLFLVHGDLHSKGLGAAIVNGVVQAARSAGFVSIHLGVVKTNAGALNFWQKMGFVYERESGDFLVFKRRVAHESV